MSAEVEKITHNIPEDELKRMKDFLKKNRKNLDILLNLISIINGIKMYADPKDFINYLLDNSRRIKNNENTERFDFIHISLLIYNTVGNYLIQRVGGDTTSIDEILKTKIVKFLNDHLPSQNRGINSFIYEVNRKYSLLDNFLKTKTEIDLRKGMVYFLIALCYFRREKYSEIKASIERVQRIIQNNNLSFYPFTEISKYLSDHLEKVDAIRNGIKDLIEEYIPEVLGIVYYYKDLKEKTINTIANIAVKYENPTVRDLLKELNKIVVNDFSGDIERLRRSKKILEGLLFREDAQKVLNIIDTCEKFNAENIPKKIQFILENSLDYILSKTYPHSEENVYSGLYKGTKEALRFFMTRVYFLFREIIDKGEVLIIEYGERNLFYPSIESLYINSEEARENMKFYASSRKEELEDDRSHIDIDTITRESDLKKEILRESLYEILTEGGKKYFVKVKFSDNFRNKIDRTITDFYEAITRVYSSLLENNFVRAPFELPRLILPLLYKDHNIYKEAITLYPIMFRLLGEEIFEDMSAALSLYNDFVSGGTR